MEVHWFHYGPQVADVAFQMQVDLAVGEANTDRFPSYVADLYLEFLGIAGALLGLPPSRFRPRYSVACCRSGLIFVNILRDSA